MRYNTDAYSDIGIKKTVNQDALLIKQANSRDRGRICMACLCDGMGGLSCGEVASATFIDRMDNWFREELPAALVTENVTMQLNAVSEGNYDCWSQIRLHWNEIVHRVNLELQRFGYENNIQLGTTAILLLIMDGYYIAMSVGDSRIYKISNGKLQQITHDQSVVQREMDAGRMTKEEAELSDQKSVLLQCIGASKVVEPDFFLGEVKEDDTFLLCSDGLWRKLSEEEIIAYTNRKNALKDLTELVKERGETDNISGIVVNIK